MLLCGSKQFSQHTVAFRFTNVWLHFVTNFVFVFIHPSTKLGTDLFPYNVNIHIKVAPFIDVISLDIRTAFFSLSFVSLQTSV